MRRGKVPGDLLLSALPGRACQPVKETDLKLQKCGLWDGLPDDSGVEVKLRGANETEMMNIH